MLNKTIFYDLYVNNISLDELIKLIKKKLRSKSKLNIEGTNVAKFIDSTKNNFLKKALNTSDINHIDGFGFYLGMKILGFKPIERIAGIDLMYEILHISNQERYRVFFLGAKDDILFKAVSNIQKLFPDLKVAGYINGYFDEKKEKYINNLINKSNADILFIGISSPKKEYYIKRNWNNLNVTLAMGVGGSFDVIAGKVKRAPIIIQKMYLEWFFRFIQEPKRLFLRYFITNLFFLKFIIIKLLYKVFKCVS